MHRCSRRRTREAQYLALSASVSPDGSLHLSGAGIGADKVREAWLFLAAWCDVDQNRAANSDPRRRRFGALQPPFRTEGRLVKNSHPSRGSYAFAVNLDLDKDLRPYELIDNQQHLRPHLRVAGMSSARVRYCVTFTR
jgi:hypothetical protein